MALARGSKGMVARKTRATAILLLLLPMVASSLAAEITKDNVLMVVNAASADSLAIRDAYLAKYPGVRVWTYTGSTDVSTERTTFDSELRGPLDTYLRSQPSGETQPLYKTIRVLVLTKGIPRRIWDIDGHTIGDDVNAMITEFTNNRFDAACVDSDLVLLHQNLSAGSEPEPAGGPKNYANNYVFNPFYQTTSRIDSFSRDNATVAKNLTFSGYGWINGLGRPSVKLTAGDIYLVTRLSGYTAAEAIAALNRTGTIGIDRSQVSLVFDGDATNGHDVGDYGAACTLLAAERIPCVHDVTDTFLTTSSNNLLGYASYGVNHRPSPPISPSGLYITDLLSFQLNPGAVFNTYESFNGRNFETPSPHDAHGQVADWIRVGGTCGLGHVFEPLASGVARDSILYDRMLLREWTYVEAAYAALPYISWENVVIGDPLARLDLLPDAYGWEVVASHGPAGDVASSVADGYIEPRAQGLRTLRVSVGEPIDPASLSPMADAVTLVGQTHGDQSGRIGSLTLDATGKVLTIALDTPLPNADTYTVTLTPMLTTTGGEAYVGRTTLTISALAGDVNGSGSVTGADMLAVRPLSGSAATVETARIDVSGSGTIGTDDMVAVRGLAGSALP
jgi:hypothetical protein